ncbi:MAG: antibiotic biosynthesis monooxygenase [Verrucomicrobiae bacterium]|nr:antibiotic biosynthesis monooxygenase [Verrucomicrobiae bacterium]
MSFVPVTVVARIQAQAGRESELREILSALLAPTRGEEGCLNYDLHQAAEDPTVFLFHENWRSREDLDRHLGSAHVTEALGRAAPLVAGAPEIGLYSRVG